MKKHFTITIVGAVCLSLLLTAVSFRWSPNTVRAANTYSLSLVGSSSQYATLTDTGLPTGNSPWTVEAWINSSSNNVGGTVFHWGAWSQNGETSATVYCRDKIAFYTPGLIADDFSYTSMAPGEWHHCAASYDGSTTISYYLDGRFDGSQTLPGALNLTSDQTAYLGAYHDTAGESQFFDGLIEHGRLWNVERSESQISEDMYNFDLQSALNLVANWKLDNNYVDSSGNGYTLTPQNSPTFVSSIPTKLTARKTTSTHVASNATTQPDGQLTLTLEANKTYIIDGVIFATSTNATPDLKFDFAATSASELIIGYIASDGSSQGQSGGVLLDSRSTGIVAVSANTPIPVKISGTVKMSSTPGNFVFEWAQNTSNANSVTVTKGSYLRAQEIP